MPSPFPGMDPYLEGYYWPDFHYALVDQIAVTLAQHLNHHYRVDTVYTVVENAASEMESGLWGAGEQAFPIDYTRIQERATLSKHTAPASTLAATQTIPLSSPEGYWFTVEIRDAERERLVTCIEVLSPLNKREPGLKLYRDKRHHLRLNGVHLLEIDLLRGGDRTLVHTRVPKSGYLITLIRTRRNAAEMWPVALPTPLPRVPVPLHNGHPDLTLDLAAAMTAAFEVAELDTLLDRAQDVPPPTLSDDESNLVKQVLGK